MAKLACVLLVLISIFQLARSAETWLSHWNVPDGSAGNFASTYYNGDMIHLSWVGWDSSYTDGMMNKETQANLYVNAWTTRLTNFSKPIKSPVDVSSNGDFNWKIDIDATTLATTHEFSFTFKPVGSSYENADPRIYSPGIKIYAKESSTSTSSSPTSTGTSTGTSTAASTATSTAASATSTDSTSNTTSGTSGLSPGAKAGIGVGVSVAALAVLGVLGLLFFRRRRGSSQAQSTTKFSELDPGSTAGHGGSYHTSIYASGASDRSPVELASTVNEK